jgi:NAD(P)-dependent dehydrogenase (short-subunit alcohol dehydrogenase family)
MPAGLRGAYCASKYAVEGLMLSLRQELAESGIHVSLIEPGPVASNIHKNGMTWFLKNVDYGNSVHRAGYRAQLEGLRAAPAKRRANPEIVYQALRHALVSRSPRPHYVVTVPARIGILLKRLLPAPLLYRLLARTA